MVTTPGRTARGRAVYAVVAMGVVACAAGCNRPPTRAELQAKFAEAERLCLDQRYGEAQAALKSYLLLDPLHPGAHFYLGLTYFATFDIRDSVLAENEFQLALQLFENQGRQSGIKRFDPRYFELMCNLNTAKTLCVQADVLIQDRSLHGIARGVLARAQEFVERGRAINPKAADVSEIEAYVNDLAAALNATGR